MTNKFVYIRLLISFTFPGGMSHSKTLLNCLCSHSHIVTEQNRYMYMSASAPASALIAGSDIHGYILYTNTTIYSVRTKESTQCWNQFKDDKVDLLNGLIWFIDKYC